MSRARALVVALLAGPGLIAVVGAAPVAAQDGFAGLPSGPGREETYYACHACHSIRLVTQQRLARQRWDQLLDEMVAKQGMAPLPEADRALVLGYLAEHFNPDVPR